MSITVDEFERLRADNKHLSERCSALSAELERERRQQKRIQRAEEASARAVAEADGLREELGRVSAELEAARVEVANLRDDQRARARALRSAAADIGDLLAGLQK